MDSQMLKYVALGISFLVVTSKKSFNEKLMYVGLIVVAYLFLFGKSGGYI